MKKPKVRIKRVVLAIIAMVIIVASVYYLVVNFTGKEKTEKATEVINEIKEYGYTLNDNETKLYNDLFKSLKDTLEADKVNEEDYASLISELFVADFYNLDNKLTNNDIGGIQFVETDAQANFILKAQDTIYKYVKSNMDGDRDQDLPKIKSIEVNGVYDKEFTYGSNTDKNAYEIKLIWEYEEDLGYETSATLIVVHETEKKLAIVELN